MTRGPLSSQQEEAVESGVFAILERSGFRVMNDHCLSALEAWGCVVDKASQLVKLPPSKTTEVITAAQKHYAGPDSHLMPPGTPAGGIQPLYHDRDGNTRPATTEDMLLCTKIIDSLPGVTTVGPPLTNSEIGTFPPLMGIGVGMTVTGCGLFSIRHWQTLSPNVSGVVMQ